MLLERPSCLLWPLLPASTIIEMIAVAVFAGTVLVEVNQIALHVTFRVIGVTEAKSKPL